MFLSKLVALTENVTAKIVISIKYTLKNSLFIFA